MIDHLSKKELLPVVIFTFSKRMCDEHADNLSTTDLCASSEKSKVHIIIEKSLSRLHGDDKELPQIRRMRGLLSRGIAVHHGGLLPIIKEVCNIMFCFVRTNRNWLNNCQTKTGLNSIDMTQQINMAVSN